MGKEEQNIQELQDNYIRYNRHNANIRRGKERKWTEVVLAVMMAESFQKYFAIG